MHLLQPATALLSVVLAFASMTAFSGEQRVDCRTTRELNDPTQLGKPRSFEIRGTVVANPFASGFVIEDETGIALFSSRYSFLPKVGELVIAEGYIYRAKNGRPWIEIVSGKVLGSGTPSPPVDATVAEIACGRFDNRFVRTSGTVLDILPDEIDGNVIYLFLSDQKKSITLACRRADFPMSASARLINAQASVVGFCTSHLGDSRRFQARGVLTSFHDISVVHPPPTDPFDVPEIKSLSFVEPEEVAALTRHRIDGTVLAICDNRRFLLASTNQPLVSVSLAKDDRMPAVGDTVRVVGFPETDMYNLNFTRAVWRPHAGRPLPPPAAETASADLIAPFGARRQYEFSYHGKTVALTGTVRHIFKDGRRIRLTLEDGQHIFPVDASACPAAVDNLTVGCRISFSGICLMDIDPWRPSAPFPQIRGFTVIARSADAIDVLARPPWWTPLRLLIVIGVLVLVIAAVMAWNIVLRAVAERRGRDLFKSQIDKVGSDLKVNERTRLAVELHDALSQNLTGVSLQLDAVKRFADEDRDKRTRHLDLAMRSLKSCRDELRNCLWDLKNHALEEKDMNEAIRRTVSPFVGDAVLLIRFNVPRDQISDNTTHALMRIVRELATNAVRHGRAKTIRIAGALENGRLLISVSDDGIGFDPQRHPDVDEGHFGLDGIRERVSRFDGTLEIESAPGKGSTIRISMTA